ncbi:hypothetical protein B0H14DRAFT_2718661, partial [Mycena olivaceomarginata]
LCPYPHYVARHLISALPPPLPIATSAPHPANVSSADIDIDIDFRHLSPHPDGYDSPLSSASYPESPGSDFSLSRRPLRSSRRSTRRTLPCTRRAPPQTCSLRAGTSSLYKEHRATPRARVRSRSRESQQQYHSPQQLQHHSPAQHHPSRFR